MRTNRTCWVVVADGARARILANDGPGEGLRNAIGRDFVADNRKARDIASDRPGRSAGANGAHHGVEPKIDEHQYEKQQFAHEMAKLINDACGRRKFGALVLVAPARTLGDLKGALDKQARALIKGEIRKDLTKLAIRDLGPHMEGIIRL